MLLTSCCQLDASYKFIFLDCLTVVCRMFRIALPHRSGIPVISGHPQINYMSLSVSEMMDETFDVSDVIALQYLTNVSRPDLMHVVGNQHLNVTELMKLASLDHRQTSVHMDGSDSFYDRHLSLASRQYLQRHNLMPPNEENYTTERGATACQHSVGDNTDKTTSERSEHVLDIQRLKNLPKLF